MCFAGAVASSSHPCFLLNDEGKFASHHPSTEEPPRSIARRVTRLCTLQRREASLIRQGLGRGICQSITSCAFLLSREDRVELCKQFLQTRGRHPGIARTGWALQAMLLAFAPWMLICLSLPATRGLGNSRFVDDSVAMVILYNLSTQA